MIPYPILMLFTLKKKNERSKWNQGFILGGGGLYGNTFSQITPKCCFHSNFGLFEKCFNHFKHEAWFTVPISYYIYSVGCLETQDSMNK